MMLIVKDKQTRQFSPRHEYDLPMFMHCCNGMISVVDISGFIPVMNNHGIQPMIQDETYEYSEDKK